MAEQRAEPSVGVLTIVHGRADHLARQHRSLAAGTRPPDAYVAVAMGDPAVVVEERDGLRRDVVHLPAGGDGLPLAGARNLGAEHLLERGVDVVVALDVDCLAGPTLVQAYADAVDADERTVWSGPVTYLPPPGPTGYVLADLPGLDAPHPARPAPPPGQRWPQTDRDLFWSLSFAVSPRAWRATGGFCEDYRGYGGEDTDFARLASAAGLGFGWVGSARAYHQHHPVSDPPVEHVADLLRNGALFAARWGEWPMRGWFEALERRGLLRRDGDGWAALSRPGG